MSESRHISFWPKKLVFFLTLAIIGTTLFSWFNVNSWLIILLVAFRLVDGGRPLDAVRAAFSDRFFLAYFSLFAIEAAGMLYTHDLYTAYKHVETKATLVAVPFILCSGGAIDRKWFRQLLRGYCWLLTAAALLCLVVAGYRLRQTGKIGVFFYHALTDVIGMNAVFFSAYVFIALVFLLSPEGKGVFRGVLIVFFTAVMILLDSKLMLALQAIVFLVFLRGGRRVWLTWRQSAGLVALIVAAVVVLAVTRNPVAYRYGDILHDDWRYVGVDKVSPDAVFNGVSLRLLIWQFGGDILNEKKAWVIGVSGGDSQDLLNRKYLAADMHRKFLGYNFHNQFIEILVRSGTIGLCVFFMAIGMLVVLARRTGTIAAWLVLGMLLLLALTESTLEMQHSLFLFVFFPLLFRYGRAGPAAPMASAAPVIPSSGFVQGSSFRPAGHDS